MRSFKEVLQDTRGSREYNFRIKFVSELDDKHIDTLERVLDKYDLIELTGPKSTIVQEHPLDFQDINNSEVLIFNAKTALPISAYVLLQEIRTELDIPEKFVIVRTDNDPMEVETERLRAYNRIRQEAEDKGLHKDSYLSTEQTYDESERMELKDPAYGEEYNNDFREYLAQIAATRRNMTYDAHSRLHSKNEVVEDQPPMVDYSDFNDHIKDAPKPVYSRDVKSIDDPQPKIRKHTSDEGNFDDDTKHYSKIYRDEKGKKVSLTQSTEGIRSKNNES